MSHDAIASRAKEAAAAIVAKIPNLNTSSGVEALRAKREEIHDLAKRNDRMRLSSTDKGVQESARERSEHLYEVMDQLSLLWPKQVVSDPAQATVHKSKANAPQPAVTKTPARLMAEANVKGMKALIDLHVTPLKARIAELERNVGKSSEVQYRGVFKFGETYDRGQFCTKDGALWHANRMTTKAPGDGPDWTLSVQRGEPGASAYRVARKNGFVGDEREWLRSLRATK